MLLNLKIEPALHDAAHIAARRKGLSLSELIRRHLRETIAAQGVEPPPVEIRGTLRRRPAHG